MTAVKLGRMEERLQVSPTVRELTGPGAALGYAAMHELRGHSPAHRLYLRFGFDITAHHFGKLLK